MLCSWPTAFSWLFVKRNNFRNCSIALNHSYIRCWRQNNNFAVTRKKESFFVFICTKHSLTFLYQMHRFMFSVAWLQFMDVILSSKQIALAFTAVHQKYQNMYRLAFIVMCLNIYCRLQKFTVDTSIWNKYLQYCLIKF